MNTPIKPNDLYKKTKMIAVVIPCYKVKNHILDVLGTVGKEISHIYIVDDACPEKSGEFVEKNTNDSRVRVLYHEKNKGVGGAVISGYKQAISDGVDIIVKVDGDGQMNPKYITKLILPIEAGEADYTKGNRFFDIEKQIGRASCRERV